MMTSSSSMPLRWRPGAGLLHPGCGLAEWLLDPGSLTRRVKRSCGAAFAVRVLGQGWMRPLPEEALSLGLRHGAVALVREVFLLCGATPWVYGRTVIPRRSMHGQRHLARLGSQPLGELLFTHPRMRHGPVETTRIGPASPLFARATQELTVLPERLWGRRRRFVLDGRVLLVSDVFLPSLEARAKGPAM